MNTWLRSFCLVTMLLALTFAGGSLTACSSNGKIWNPEDYTVKSGDTLYSIAWRYELDTEDFAAWNNLRASSSVKAGQRLHTRKPDGFDANQSRTYNQSIAYAPLSSSKRDVSKSKSDQQWVKVEKGDTLYGLSRRHGVDVKRLAQLNQLKQPYALKPGQTIFLKPLNTTAKTRSLTPSKSAKQSQPAKQTQVPAKNISWPRTVRWQRPANGKIIKKFSHRRNDAKGIDIAGKQGNAIVAAADGKVVYSGNGLISYGNLIIIKHNKTFLSAYAYNRKLLVKEGDVVKAGQQVAEMGGKDKLNALLHFEIRKNGKPVDPLKYLPW